MKHIKGTKYSYLSLVPLYIRRLGFIFKNYLPSVYITTILRAVGIIFIRPRYAVIGIATAIIMFTLLILLPVGRFGLNAFHYQLAGLDWISRISFGLFSLLIGILIAMNSYVFHISRKNAVGRGVVSSVVSFFAGIFGSAVCAVCLAILFGLLGIPIAALSFILAYRLHALAISSLIALTSLYLSSKAIVAHESGCNICRVA